MDESEQALRANDMAGLAGRSLLFMHIPKTAGTSFRDLLGRRFNPDRVLAIDSQGKHGMLDKLSAADRFQFVHGHIPYVAMNHFSTRPFLFTVLREPIDRAISAFHFMKQQAVEMEQKAAAGQISRQRASDYTKASVLSLSEFVLEEPLAAARHLGNIQVELLTCGELERRQKFDSNYTIDVSEVDLELAKQRLSGFDAIGLMERLQESKELLAYALGTRPFDELAWSNKTRTRPRVDEIDEETLRALRALTFYDNRFYDFATELFERRGKVMLREREARQAEPVRVAAGVDDRPRPSSFTSGTPVPGEGWYAPEHDGNRWFNWTGPSPESWIELGTPAGLRFVLEISVVHALKVDSLFDLELLVNGAPLKPEVHRSAIGHTILAKVDGHHLRDVGWGNRITLRVPHLARPCDLDPMNDDSRTLGLAVQRIELKSVR